MTNYKALNFVKSKEGIALITGMNEDAKTVNLSIITNMGVTHRTVTFSQFQPIRLWDEGLDFINEPIGNSVILDYPKENCKIELHRDGAYSVYINSQKSEKEKDPIHINFLHELQNIVRDRTGRCFV